MFYVASAQNINANTNINLQTQVNTTSTATKNINATNTNTNSKLTTGKLPGTPASPAVSLILTTSVFTQSLLNIADRENAIGNQLHEIINTQNNSASTSASAMVKVEEKGFIKTFFFGSDYKNLGIIRSELATTSNVIKQLKLLLDKTTDNENRTLLNTQIQILEAAQIKSNTYVTTHENAFSLFGWFTKLFLK